MELQLPPDLPPGMRSALISCTYTVLAKLKAGLTIKSLEVRGGFADCSHVAPGLAAPDRCSAHACIAGKQACTVNGGLEALALCAAQLAGSFKAHVLRLCAASAPPPPAVARSLFWCWRRSRWPPSSNLTSPSRHPTGSPARSSSLWPWRCPQRHHCQPRRCSQVWCEGGLGARLEWCSHGRGSRGGLNCGTVVAAVAPQPRRLRW